MMFRPRFAWCWIGFLAAALPAHAQRPQGDAGGVVAAAPSLRLTAASNRHGRFDLISVDLDGKQAETIVSDPKGVMEPAWSPDGRRLAMVSFRTGVGQIFVMDKATGSVVNITNTDGYERNPAWSPDGKKIAFTSNRSGNQDIWMMDADGGNPVNLTQHAGYDADPAWSPDGKQIAFASMRDGDPFRVFAMGADGSNQRALSDELLSGWVYPDWSPDGKHVVVAKYADGAVQLQILSVSEGTLTPISDASGVNSFARWSPDGRRIAYAHFDGPPQPFIPGHTELDLAAAGGDLMIYDVATKTRRPVLRGELPLWGPRPSWQPAAGR